MYIWAGLPEHSFLNNMISNKISQMGKEIYKLEAFFPIL